MGVIPKFWQRKAAPLFGLDISASAVKLVELAGSPEQPEVVAFAVEGLPEGAIAERQVIDRPAVVTAIKRAVQRSHTRSRRAAVAVSGAAVITRVITLPAFLSEDDMEDQIRVEADQFIPYPIDEVSLDFEVLGPSKGEADAVDVLLAACRREQIEALTQLLEEAGLEAAVVDAEPFALENTCVFLRHQMPDEGKGRNIAVVDLGNHTMHITVLHDGNSVFTRENALGGRQLTEEIARAYGMEIPEAAQRKKSGELPDNYREELLLPFLDEVAQQIDRAFQIFFSSVRVEQRVDQLLLAGGSAYLPGIDEHLGQRLQVPVAIVRPLSVLDSTRRARASHLEREEAALLLAIGLASRVFDKPR